MFKHAKTTINFKLNLIGTTFISYIFHNTIIYNFSVLQKKRIDKFTYSNNYQFLNHYYIE